MKIIMFFTLLFFMAFNGFAQTQTEMNQQAIVDYKTADSILNGTYKNVIFHLKGNQKQMLLIAQRNWVKFKTTHCETVALSYEGGSMQPLVKYSCLTEVTKERTRQLENLIKEGN